MAAMASMAKCECHNQRVTMGESTHWCWTAIIFLPWRIIPRSSCLVVMKTTRDEDFAGWSCRDDERNFRKVMMSGEAAEYGRITLLFLQIPSGVFFLIIWLFFVGVGPHYWDWRMTINCRFFIFYFWSVHINQRMTVNEQKDSLYLTTS